MSTTNETPDDDEATPNQSGEAGSDGGAGVEITTDPDRPSTFEPEEDPQDG
jgi:hypothetical protein